MASQRFQITYPDGSKKKISDFAREQLLLAGEIRLIEGNRYRFTGQAKTYHSFSELAEFKPSVEPVYHQRHYPGTFVIHDTMDRKRREILESPGAYIERLENTFVCMMRDEPVAKLNEALV